MGVSTDAILFYGIHDPETEASDLSNVQERLADRFGPQVYWPDDGGDLHYLGEFIEEKYPGLEVDWHCSGDYPVLFVYAEKFRAWRGEVVEVGILPRPTEKQSGQLLELAELLGWEGPGVFLVSYWG